MKYRNASEVLPDELLREIQKYASGEALYIPTEKNHREWGEKSGSKVFYKERNEDIKYKFKHGISIDQLSSEYNLSVDTIRNIIYR